MNNQAGHGRIRIVDERDHNHLMPRRASPVGRRTWWTPAPWDQGNSPMCVAYGTNRFLVSSPVRNKPFGFEWLYYEAQKLDEWPGENYEGTSVRAAMKVLQREGLISGYEWAFDARPVVDHLLAVGPVVIGTAWDAELANPDKHSYISPGPNFAAATDGHCTVLVGADRIRKNPDGTFGAVRLFNSWGANWGDNGRAWVTFEDLDLMIRQGGEAAVATEVLK